MTTATKHDSKVITWQSANGETIAICPTCQATLEAAGQWPKDSRGGEYCRVSHGLHRGSCEYQD
jgi:hypothetical protein